MSGLPNEEVKKMYGAITCPTLLMRGEESWASDPVADGRTQCFNCPIEYRSFANAGHWVHHDQLDAFVATVNEFLAK
jgi:pimeloyl-ACP methyl ester carboxylesterase